VPEALVKAQEQADRTGQAISESSRKWPRWKGLPRKPPNGWRKAQAGIADHRNGVADLTASSRTTCRCRRQICAAALNRSSSTGELDRAISGFGNRSPNSSPP
jgi:hypothetical protein